MFIGNNGIIHSEVGSLIRDLISFGLLTTRFGYTSTILRQYP